MDKPAFWKTTWFRVVAVIDIVLVTILLIIAILEKYDDHFGIHPYSVNERIIVARNDLPSGHTLTPDDFAYRDRNILHDLPNVTIQNSVAGLLVGKTLTSEISTGRPIYRRHIALDSPASEWPPRYETINNMK